MSDPISDLVRAIVRETIAELAPHLRGADEIIPLARAAEQIGVRVRVLRDAASRGELAIEGPRAARVVRRAELDRWLAAHRVTPTPRVADDDPRADARSAVARAAARWGSR